MYYDYGPHNDHEHGNNKPPRMQHHTSMTGKIDQGNSMADDWRADVHFSHHKLQDQMPLSSVKFDLEKTSILLYDACEVDEGGSVSNDYSFSSSRSEEVSFKTNTDRVIKACRQELLDDVEDVIASSNWRQRIRDCGIKGRLDMDHLISSISINKNLVSKDLLTSVTSCCVKIMTNTKVVRAIAGTDISKEASC